MNDVLVLDSEIVNTDETILVAARAAERKLQFSHFSQRAEVAIFPVSHVCAVRSQVNVDRCSRSVNPEARDGTCQPVGSVEGSTPLIVAVFNRVDGTGTVGVPEAPDLTGIHDEYFIVQTVLSHKEVLARMGAADHIVIQVGREGLGSKRGLRAATDGKAQPTAYRATLSVDASDGIPDHHHVFFVFAGIDGYHVSRFVDIGAARFTIATSPEAVSVQFLILEADGHRHLVVTEVILISTRSK